MGTGKDELGGRWAPGPWDDEPDSVEWVTEAGLTAVAVRHDVLGNWCGYVAVPESNPAYRRREVDVQVHGGVTYANRAPPCDPVTGDTGWWLGFDCAHAWDLVPGMMSVMAAIRRVAVNRDLVDRVGATYRDVEFVKGECESLAEQIVKLALH